MADQKTIHQRMVAILAELPAIGKSQKNQQQNFMYRGHDDVLNALNPLLAKHGVFVVPDVLERVTAQRQTKSGTTMYEVNLHVAYTFYGEEGGEIQASAWGEGTDSGDKSTNKAMTMAFKNVLAQTFAVSTAEGATYDTDGHTPEETARAFDPSIDLLPNAIKGAGATKRIGDALSGLDPTVDWGLLFESIDEGWRKLKGEDAEVFWRRTSNATQRLADQFPAGTLPPPTASQIQAAFSEMFSGLVVNVLYQEPEEKAPLSAEQAAAADVAGDDVPFGDAVEGETEGGTG